ncbi:hypothetical protein GF318_00820 [Candidatus Micrarchaeota archaeon]|nr:hypothetical protein [Candidatus Micrarchaeota archaeon]
MPVLIASLSLFALLLFGCTAPPETPALNDSEEPEQENISEGVNYSNKTTAGRPKGIMFMIEYENTTGLSNFVNEMDKRDISGLLMVSPEFVNSNCGDIKQVIKHDVEIVACNVESPFWDAPYDEQKERIIEMTEGIENCTGEPVRIVSSRYFASDMNTIKVAEELGIPYVTARGTTNTKATVYQPEGYNVSVLSVSNIPWVLFEYGSLCDYSFYERAGTPENMSEELRRAVEPLSEKEKERYGKYHRISPVSHTRIGGLLRPWNDMWLEFWDTTDVEWVGLDEFMENPDWRMPLWQLPINKNAPYTAEKIRPLTPYEEEEKVQNPCAAPGIGSDGNASAQYVGDRIVMYHNGQGEMCLEAMDFLETVNYTVETHLENETGFESELNSLIDAYGESKGKSSSYGYYPIIFVKNKSYSGFGDQIKNEILEGISE